MLNRDARLGWQAGERAGTKTRRFHNTTSEVFYNARGQVCAVYDAKTRMLVKHVDTRKHQLQKPRAFALDVEHIDKLRALKAHSVKLIDESNRVYVATLKAFDEFAIKLDRGHGAQLALPLARWTVHDNAQLSFVDELAS